jgi:Ran GTPase-activating protein (RanGAP) involved in mRNA processing and transport
LEKKNTVTGFRLSDNPIGKDSNIGIRLTRALFKPNVIVVLDINACALDKHCTTAVFQMLESNTSLTELNISGNETNREGLKALSRSLIHNKTLVKLGIRHCGIGKDGFAIIAEAIEKNETLSELDLAFNDLDSIQAARRFGDALIQSGARAHETKSKTALQSLNLASCSLGYKHIEEFVEGFSRNRSVSTLHLDGNDLGGRGLRAVSIGVKDNPALRILTVQKASLVTDDICEFLDRIASTSTHLEIFDCRKNDGVLPQPNFQAALSHHNKLSVLNDAVVNDKKDTMYVTMQRLLQTSSSRRNLNTYNQ